MIKPGDSEEMGNPPDPPRLGWVERSIIRLIVPKDYREEFVADLLEEYEEIRRVGATQRPRVGTENSYSALSSLYFDGG